MLGRSRAALMAVAVGAPIALLAWSILATTLEATGVRLAGGETMRAGRAVICNVTPTQLYGRLLQPGDVPEEVARLKQQPGQSIIMYGCGELARTLLEHDLIDEFLFWVYPVVRGSGTRLFGGATRADLRLVETRAFGAGFAVLTCQPTRNE
jgi:riboflavin biosynthesis pyrimidine reductase